MRTNVPTKLAAAVFAFALLPIAPMALTACGGSEPAPATPSTDTTAPDGAAPTAAASGDHVVPPAPDPSIAWKDMNHEQRIGFMAHTVMPQMKKEFADFDAKNWGNINCHTCHGPGAKDGTFKMPNAELPPVPTTKEGFEALMAKQPDVTKFMMNKVVPDMAKLLGEAPYDPKTQQGFGCHDCHTAGTPTGSAPHT